MAREMSLGEWLYQRFGKHYWSGVPLSWGELSSDDQKYWEHEAKAVTRTVVRGGFKYPVEQGPGLHEKFFVKRIEDETGKHNECRYFVLDPLHDPIARHALAYYGGATEAEGNLALAEDINQWLRSLSNSREVKH